jgi:hypothetical protein
MIQNSHKIFTKAAKLIERNRRSERTQKTTKQTISQATSENAKGKKVTSGSTNSNHKREWTLATNGIQSTRSGCAPNLHKPKHELFPTTMRLFFYDMQMEFEEAPDMKEDNRKGRGKSRRKLVCPKEFFLRTLFFGRGQRRHRDEPIHAWESQLGSCALGPGSFAEACI